MEAMTKGELLRAAEIVRDTAGSWRNMARDMMAMTRKKKASALDELVDKWLQEAEELELLADKLEETARTAKEENDDA